MRLKDKVALVTGGASGLGEAIAFDFASEGACVAICDVEQARANAVADRINGSGGTAAVFHVDVTAPDTVEQAVSDIGERLGAIDILVNSAGVARIKPFLETSLDDFDLVHAVNVRGTFLAGQVVARTMVGRGGAIINIASASGRRGNYGRAAYGPGKAAIVSLTEIMAVELAEHGVRVNVIAPGPVETPIIEGQLTDEGRRAWTAVIPMGRWGRPEEIAKVATFLASEDSSFVTGHCLDADGGFRAGGILRP